jgi:hypothetical protein
VSENNRVTSRRQSAGFSEKREETYFVRRSNPVSYCMGKNGRLNCVFTKKRTGECFEWMPIIRRVGFCGPGLFGKSSIPVTYKNIILTFVLRERDD